MIETQPSERPGAAIVDEAPSQRPSQPPSGPLVALSNERLVEYVTSRAAELADDRSAKRDLRYRTLMGVVLVALGLLGYQRLDTAFDQKGELLSKDAKLFEQSVQADLAALRENYGLQLNSIATDRVADALKDQSARVSELDGRIASVSRSIDEIDKGFKARARLEELRDEVQKWTKQNGISNAEIDSSLAEFNELIKAPDSIVQAALPDLCSALMNQLVLLNSDRAHAAVNSMDDMGKQWLMERPNDCGAMETHYALRILGTALPIPDDRERFDRYTAVLHKLGFAAVALPDELVMAYTRARTDPRAAQDLELLKQAALERGETDRSSMLGILNTIAQSDAREVAAARLYADFITDNADFMSALKDGVGIPKKPKEQPAGR
jgi:hypothetical protein